MLKSLTALKNLSGKRVLVRCDFDVPLKKLKLKNKKLKIQVADDARLRAALPTIKYLLAHQAKIILIGHLGRPAGRVVPELSLLPVKNQLEKLIQQSTIPGRVSRPRAGNNQQSTKIKFINIERYLGNQSKKSVKQLKSGEIIMLENLRFSDREGKNCRRFAKNLASLADYYINESFANSHRPAASMFALQDYLPSFAGFNLMSEIKKLSYALSRPAKPLVVIIGGAKIETKLPVINNFLTRAEYLLLGGVVANDFIKALGYEVGQSLVDEKYVSAARKILNKLPIQNSKVSLKNKNLDLFKNSKIKNSKIILPLDVRTNLRITVPDQVKPGEKILDLGPKTVQLYTAIIKSAQTIIWNGPLGYFEDKKFRVATAKIAAAIIKSRARALIGGGETGELFKNKKIPAHIFLSTGGGAMLEFLAGKKLPGLRKL